MTGWRDFESKTYLFFDDYSTKRHPDSEENILEHISWDFVSPLHPAECWSNRKAKV